MSTAATSLQALTSERSRLGKQRADLDLFLDKLDKEIAALSGPLPAEHTDFFGQPLAVGDFVAFEQPGYRNLVLGRIASFTPKQVRVLWTNRTYGTAHLKHEDIDGNKWGDTFLTYPNTLIKRPKTA